MSSVLKNGVHVLDGVIKASDFIKTVAMKDGVNRKWSGTWSQLEDLTMKHFSNSSPGTGSNNGDVLLIRVPSQGFFTNIVKLDESNKHLVETIWEARVSGEAEVPARVIFVDKYVPASCVDIVIYRADLLDKDKDRSSEAEWEIVSINAQPEENVPMHPETMKRNARRQTGGTYREYTSQQWRTSEDYWDNHVQLRISK